LTTIHVQYSIFQGSSTVAELTHSPHSPCFGDAASWTDFTHYFGKQDWPATITARTIATSAIHFASWHLEFIAFASLLQQTTVCEHVDDLTLEQVPFDCQRYYGLPLS